MPQKIETQPSPSLLERIQNFFGYGPLPQNIQEGMRIAKEQGVPTDNVSQMGPIGRFFGSKATAVATPSKTIEMNVPGMTGQSPMDVAAILAHENEHINQMNKRGTGYLGEIWHRYMSGDVAGVPYAQRPDEMGAYQVEKNFRRRNKQSAISIPNFSDPNGNWMDVGGDVNLPLTKSPEQQQQEYLARIRRNAGMDVGPSLARVK